LICQYQVSSTRTANGIHSELWKCDVNCTFTVRKILISTANKKYIIIKIINQYSLGRVPAQEYNANYKTRKK
jgi:hypothetical protein